MTAPHHDSAAWLEVWYRPAWIYPPSQCARKGLATASGWFVRRTCPCHDGLLVSVRFDTEVEAERCLRVLDEDCRLRQESQKVNEPTHDLDGGARPSGSRAQRPGR